MKPMICTSRLGTRSRSSPASRSRGSVVAASVRLASTPSVPLASRAQAAARPDALTATPSRSTRGPVAMNGISTANTTNGTSTTIRLRRYVAGTRLTATTATSSRRYPA